MIKVLMLLLFMPSSVTISESLRRRIKRLAAIYDTSQADIINTAISEFEKCHRPYLTINDPELTIFLAKVSEKVHLRDPERKKRYLKLSGPGIQVDDVVPASWGRSVDK